MTIYTKESGKKPNPDYAPPASKLKIEFDPLEILELEKAMLGRGIDYETAQLVLSDFYNRVKYLYDR